MFFLKHGVYKTSIINNTVYCTSMMAQVYYWYYFFISPFKFEQLVFFYEYVDGEYIVSQHKTALFYTQA